MIYYYHSNRMNNYRPASIARTTEDSMKPVSNSIIDVLTESTEVGEREVQTSEDRAVDQASTSYHFEWDSEKSIAETVNEQVKDTEIVKWILYIAQNWTKSISQWELWIAEVDDHTIQLAAWKMLAQMKWHFDQKKKKDTRNKNIKYVLIPDGK